MMTPYEKFRYLPKPSQCLEPGVTLKSLNAFTNEMTDDEAAEQLNLARGHIFKQRHERLKIRAEYNLASGSFLHWKILCFCPEPCDVSPLDGRFLSCLLFHCSHL